jgi:phosphoglycolate phosphatase
MIAVTRPKLLLFDIDGTLLSARGLPKIVMNRVLVNRYPGMLYDHDYDFSGRTDPEIIDYLLRYNKRRNDSRLISSILEEFVIELETEFIRNHKPFLLEGVEALIKNLAEIEGVCLGLVTGNIARGAQIKLEPVGLLPFFPVGGFGDDSKDRNKLPPIAISRAQAYYTKTFMQEDIWIIGDSIYDIACAAVNNLRCLAVASGRTAYDILAAAQPEFLEEDMSDVDLILDILLTK